MPDGVAIAIPTYNEVDNIQKLIPEIQRARPRAQIFVIDDASPDGTADAVKRMMSASNNIQLISRPRKEGLSAAYLHAFRVILAQPDVGFVVTMDADLSHDPQHLPAFFDVVKVADLVVGSRYIAQGAIENWSLPRRVLSRYGNHYARYVTGLPVRDLTAGYVLYRREILERILASGISSTGYAYQIEMKWLAVQHGGRIREVPITFCDRGGGVSKLEGGTVWEGILRPWRLRFRGRP